MSAQQDDGAVTRAVGQVDWQDVQEGGRYASQPMEETEALRRAVVVHGHRLRVHRADPALATCDCGMWLLRSVDEAGAVLIGGTALADDCPWMGCGEAEA